MCYSSFISIVLMAKVMPCRQEPLAEKGRKVEEFLREQDRQVQELKGHVHELKGELAAATKRRTMGELQVSQLRDQYYQNLEKVSHQVCAREAVA